MLENTHVATNTLLKEDYKKAAKLVTRHLHWFQETVKMNTLFSYFKLKDVLPNPRGPLSSIISPRYFLGQSNN